MYCMKSTKDALFFVEQLKLLYPEARCSLEYGKDYELLFATRLSAQCTDERVNKVTPGLFARFPTLESLAEAEQGEVEELIRSCGFYRIKARDILQTSRLLLDEYGGKVPGDMESLLKLPGVGRKTANLILGDIFGKPGIVADTHCIRISGRLGLTDGTRDPYKVELQLSACIPPAEQSNFCHRLVLHGRALCMARSPQCGQCPLAPRCAFFCGENAAPGAEPEKKNEDT